MHFQKTVETTQLMFPIILFVQNSKVYEFNNRVATASDRYAIKTLDNVVGANSAELRDKILKQIPLDHTISFQSSTC